MRDGLAVFADVLDHVLDQLVGGDRRDDAAAARRYKRSADLTAEHEGLDVVSYQSVGAIVGFVGMIRYSDDRRRVLPFGYSEHPSAAQVFIDVVVEVADQSNPVRVPAARPSTRGHSPNLFGTIKARLPVWKH